MVGMQYKMLVSGLLLKMKALNRSVIWRLNLHMKYLAVIPARAGSKGLPNKNIANLAGKPLMLGVSSKH